MHQNTEKGGNKRSFQKPKKASVAERVCVSQAWYPTFKVGLESAKKWNLLWKSKLHGYEAFTTSFVRNLIAFHVKPI